MKEIGEDQIRVIGKDSDSKKLCPLNCFLSTTEIVFYLPITVTLGVIIYILNIFG